MPNASKAASRSTLAGASLLTAAAMAAAAIAGPAAPSAFAQESAKYQLRNLKLEALEKPSETIDGKQVAPLQQGTLSFDWALAPGKKVAKGDKFTVGLPADLQAYGSDFALGDGVDCSLSTSKLNCEFNEKWDGRTEANGKVDFRALQRSTLLTKPEYAINLNGKTQKVQMVGTDKKPIDLIGEEDFVPADNSKLGMYREPAEEGYRLAMEIYVSSDDLQKHAPGTPLTFEVELTGNHIFKQSGREYAMRYHAHDNPLELRKIDNTFGKPQLNYQGKKATVTVNTPAGMNFSEKADLIVHLETCHSTDGVTCSNPNPDPNLWFGSKVSSPVFTSPIENKKNFYVKGNGTGAASGTGSSTDGSSIEGSTKGSSETNDGSSIGIALAIIVPLLALMIPAALATPQARAIIDQFRR